MPRLVSSWHDLFVSNANVESVWVCVNKNAKCFQPISSWDLSTATWRLVDMFCPYPQSSTFGSLCVLLNALVFTKLFKFLESLILQSFKTFPYQKHYSLNWKMLPFFDFFFLNTTPHNSSFCVAIKFANKLSINLSYVKNF